MKHEAINSPVELVPFADLYVSPLNPRTVFSPEGIEALAENIRQLGLIQNLAGLRDEAGKVGIVAGGRRLRALELLQNDPRFAAIPVKLADKVAKQLIKSGTATHAYLGVTLDTAGATADGEKRGGAKITSVESGSPADKAGLKTNDVVIAIDGKTTAQGSALTGYVRQYSANDKVKLTVIRDSKKQDIEVTLAERKDS